MRLVVACLIAVIVGLVIAIIVIASGDDGVLVRGQPESIDDD